MDQLDVYYRALTGYRALTSQNRESASLCKLIAQSDTAADTVVITRTVCVINDDWITEIENGLDFIDKAIKEDRQFIYSNGEVEPIEKVKHVSEESVRHLAKHSNLIGKEKDGEDLIPEKLYTVERLNDYAVYENRFLYMLLCYLRNFVRMRYEKILDLTNKYDGLLRLKKDIITSKRKITYSVELHDECMDDAYLREHNSEKETLNRIDIILRTIEAFLKTPLMEYAAKSPMLKPPITKTNVLKMDNNFKRAVALYDYINAYTEDGYIAEEQKINLAPLKADTAEELSEACAMLLFVMYEHGLGIKHMLKNSYEQEEQRRKSEADAQRKEKLESVRKRVMEGEEAPEEYILDLEQRLRFMEGENAKLDTLYKDLYDEKEYSADLESRVSDLKLNVEKLNLDISEAEISHLSEMDALRSECNKRIHENMMKHEDEARELERVCNERIEFADSEMRKAKERFSSELAEKSSALSEAEEKLESLTLELQRIEEEKRLCEAKIKAMRAQNGEMTEQDDYTEQESFSELEKEYAAFKKFYDLQWSKTKKKIRKRILNLDNIKGRKGQNN